MRVLVTGAGGFIGRNLVQRLREQVGTEVFSFVRGQSLDALNDLLARADVVVHLAGENRPTDPAAFQSVNVGLTEALCSGLQTLGKTIPVLVASSVQAELDNPYGRSKLAAERALEALAGSHHNPVAIFRLPGVFGKWCKPDYNSVVATFCHNKANDLPVQINDANACLRLVYVDDVVDAISAQLTGEWSGVVRLSVAPEYSLSVGELSAQIDAFRHSRTSLVSERVGEGFIRALYATYVSYLGVDKFTYGIPSYRDARGVFVEMLKTPDAGQFSFFTSRPGSTRGGHYHHTKTEKFLVIKGEARFRFRHVLSGEFLEIYTSCESFEIVQTLPGWTHDVTNVGDGDLICMLWASENFDRNRPDTFACAID